MSRIKIPKFETQGADFESSGFYAAADWRYELLVDYLKLSPSYSLVCRDEKTPINANERPKDWKLLMATFADFGNVHKIRESQWWASKGRSLFGIKAVKSETFVVGLSEKNFIANDDYEIADQIWQSMSKPETLVIAIPLNQSKFQVMKQFREIIKATDFKSHASSIEPKYKLQSSKLREFTLAHGITALKAYKRGKQLWEIGYQLELSPASVLNIEQGRDVAIAKSYLQIQASKLVHKAELIAENAARGRFPSDKAFPEAILISNKRKVGRPRNS
jgi:hypothetical protein